MRREILICGASGFLGRNVAERFAENKDYEVTGTYLNSKPYDNSRIRMVRADLRIEEDVKKVVKGKDIVVQMAATTSGAKDIVTRPYIHVTDNAIMNSLLLRAAFEYSVSHFIFPSCTVMYQPSDVPIKETDFNLNKEIFPSYFGVGWTKAYIEKMCQFFSRLGKTKHTVIRHSNVYGPYDKFDLERSHVFGATVTKVMTVAKGGKIVVWGDGQEKRDLLYISDLVDFIEGVTEKEESLYDLYNVGLGNTVSISDLVKKVIEASGRDVKIEYDRTKPTIKTNLCLDTTKAKEKFGWEPKISLEEGIKRTIEWYQENILSNP